MNTTEKLARLRNVMRQNNIDAVIIPSSDPHQSEYLAAHWQERTWISGFTGSAGLVVVTKDHAGLWTDSRYFLQAEIELKNTGFVLHKMYNQFASPHVDFILENLPADSTVCVNGFMVSKSALDGMKKSFVEKRINITHRLDLISEIWIDRPPLSDAKIEYLDEKFAGLNIAGKLAKIREIMQQNGVGNHLITTLDDIAWTFNIRGKDVDYNPVAIGYAVIGMTNGHFFTNPSKLSSAVLKQFEKHQIKVHDYEKMIAFLNNLDVNSTILVDPNLCNQALYEAINCKIELGTCIPKTLKAIKNDTEINHIRAVMKKDGAALAHTFNWLEQTLLDGKSVTEVEVAQKLAENRAKQKYYQGESFGAIVGYKENGAIIHYHPEPSTCKKIKPEGILLVDSGGQYSDGTTDVTRTFALNTPTDYQKKVYTLVLKGMIALSKAKFPEGTSGAQLDTYARQFLWAEGLNYGHGTGHGVGFYLNVHEPPQGFAPVHSERGRTAHLPGMLTSNEPGYYLEGEFGMRIENLILTKKSDFSGFLEFETVTLYPFDHNLIQKSLLTREEINWINDYHKTVYAGVAPYLKGDLKAWFKLKCKKI